MNYTRERANRGSSSPFRAPSDFKLLNWKRGRVTRKLMRRPNRSSMFCQRTRSLCFQALYNRTRVSETHFQPCRSNRMGIIMIISKISEPRLCLVITFPAVSSLAASPPELFCDRLLDHRQMCTLSYTVGCNEIGPNLDCISCS